MLRKIILYPKEKVFIKNNNLNIADIQKIFKEMAIISDYKKIPDKKSQQAFQSLFEKLKNNLIPPHIRGAVAALLRDNYFRFNPLEEKGLNEFVILNAIASFSNSLFPDGVKKGRLLSQITFGKPSHSIKYKNLLQGKTQVHPGYDPEKANRLTHTEEVIELTLNFCYTVNINFWAAASVAYLHDFGHVAFGHAGERALNKIFSKNKLIGGFNHALLSAMIAKEMGISEEILEGIATHEGSKIISLRENPQNFNQTFWENVIISPKYLGYIKDPKNKASFLETIAALFFDKMAYLSTDLESAIIQGIVDPKELPASFFALAEEKTSRDIRGNPENEIKAALLDVWMYDAKENSLKNLQNGIRIIGFSERVGKMKNEIVDFCRKKIYSNQNQREIDRACEIIMVFCVHYFRNKRSKNYQKLTPEEKRDIDLQILREDIYPLTDYKANETFMKNNPNKTEKNIVAKIFKKSNIKFR